MLYKFDILFKKELKGGGLKVVTYSQLLENPNVFGDGETLEGAVGTLSLTDSEKEEGYSISSLFVKYRTQLVGYYWADVFGKEFPLRFVFSNPDDVTSIRAELIDESGIHYSSDVQTFIVDGEIILDLDKIDSLVALLPKNNGCKVCDTDGELSMYSGQVAIIPAIDKTVTIQGDCHVKIIKCVN